MRSMYYQADLHQANRLFKIFLVLSVLVHGAILFYQKSQNTFLIAGLEPNTQQSFQVKLQEAFRPKPVAKPKPVKQVVKKARKKVVKKEVQVQKPQKQQTASAPPTKAFESSIRNYVNPHYPRLALRRGITGVVKLLLFVKGSGEIDKVVLAQSSGDASLDASALKAAKLWTFKELSSKTDDIYQLSKTIVYKIN